MPIVVREVGAGARPYLNKLDEELRASGIAGSLIGGVTWHEVEHVLFVHVADVPTAVQAREIDRILVAHDPTTLAQADIDEHGRAARRGRRKTWPKGYVGTR